MRRLFLLPLMLPLIATLTACTIDPCSIDSTSPTCDTRRSESQATISAIDADKNLRATDSAIYLQGQAEKSAISSQATRTVIDADATHIAMNTQATRQAISAQSTASAVVMAATQTSINGEATKIAVSTGAVIERAKAESAATPYSAVFNIVLFWFAIPATAVAVVFVYGRRAVKSATQSMSQALSKRAALVTYGPSNNPQMALVMFDPMTHQPLRIITTEGLIGPYADSDGRTAIDLLDVPHEMKLAAMVDSSKRVQAGRIAAATGHAPWGSSVVYDAPSSAPAQISPSTTQPIARVPSFAELYRQWQPTQSQMLLGIGKDGQPKYCELEDLLSTGIIGRPKTGKSTVLRFIYLQCRLVGARVVVWDLHLTIVGSLPGAEAFTELMEINQSAEEMTTLMTQRIRARDYQAQPIMILADEFNLLAPSSPDVTNAMGRIILEGRKVNMYCMVSGQGLPAKLFGDSTPRDALSSRFVLHTTTRQAQMIGLDRDALPWVVDLARGQAIVEGPIDPQVLYIPNTTEADVKALLPASPLFSEVLRATSATSREAAYAEVLRPSEVGREVAREAAVEVAADPFDPVDPTRLRVIEMLKAGASRNAIIREVYQCTGGEKYQRAAAEINQIQKELLA
jgi:hypothetical protein